MATNFWIVLTTTSQNAAQVGINPREADGQTGGGGGGSSCVVSTAFADRGIWNVQQKDELIAWCEENPTQHHTGRMFPQGLSSCCQQGLANAKLILGPSLCHMGIHPGYPHGTR
jgi:hypothetical protein